MLLNSRACQNRVVWICSLFTIKRTAGKKDSLWMIFTPAYKLNLWGNREVSMHRPIFPNFFFFSSAVMSSPLPSILPMKKWKPSVGIWRTRISYSFLFWAISTVYMVLTSISLRKCITITGWITWSFNHLLNSLSYFNISIFINIESTYRIKNQHNHSWIQMTLYLLVIELT